MIGGHSMEIVSDYRYLGVILDERLKYHVHISMIKQLIAYILSILRRIRWIIGFKESLLLYKSSILCFFDQGDIFFNAGSKNQLQALQVMQNRCLRVIYGKKNWPGIEGAHKQCNVLYIKKRRNLSLTKYAHRLSFDHRNLRNINRTGLHSCRKLLLKVRISKTTLMEKSFLVRSASLWNNLSKELKQIKNIFNFKTRVTLELLQQRLNFPE